MPAGYGSQELEMKRRVTEHVLEHKQACGKLEMQALSTRECVRV